MIRAADLVSYPEPEWVIDGEFRKASLYAVVGAKRAGKTWWLLDRAVEMAYEYSVLYITAEDLWSIPVRLLGACTKREISTKNLTLDFEFNHYDLTSGLTEIGEPYDIVIIDSVNPGILFAKIDDVVLAVARQLHYLSTRGKLCIFSLHESRKSFLQSERFTGVSALIACTWIVTRSFNTEKNTLGNRRLITPSAYGYDKTSFSVVDLNDIPTVIPVVYDEATRTAMNEPDVAILNHLYDTQAAGIRALMNTTGIKYDSLKATLRLLVATRMVSEDTRANRTIYTITRIGKRRIRALRGETREGLDKRVAKIISGGESE